MDPTNSQPILPPSNDTSPSIPLQSPPITVPVVSQPFAAPPPPDVTPVVAAQPVAAPLPAQYSQPEGPTPPLPQQSLPAQPLAAAASGIVVGGDPAPSSSTEWLTPPSGQVDQPAKSSRRFKKPLLLSAASLLVLIGLGTGFYFGYYANGSLLYGQALSSANDGYNAAIHYASPAGAQPRSYTTSGSFSAQTAGMKGTGAMNIAADASGGIVTAKFDSDTEHLTLETRVLRADTKSPQIFVKVGGIKGIVDSLGSPQLSAKVSTIDNAWISIDQNIIDKINQSMKTAATQPTANPTRAQIQDELTAAGQVNKQFVFTTDPNTEIFKLEHTVGVESVDGRNVYHYKVSLVPTHVKQYLEAQKQALLASKLGSWITQNNYQADIDKSFSTAEQSAGTMKQPQQFDMWADLFQRAIYKVRISDQTNTTDNYLEVGQNYKSGNALPIFILLHNKSGNNSTVSHLLASLNGDAKSFDATFDERTTGDASSSVSGTLHSIGKSTLVTVEVPAAAKPLSQVLNDLGLGELLQTPQAPTKLGRTTQQNTLALFTSAVQNYTLTTHNSRPSLADLRNGSLQSFITSNPTSSGSWLALSEANQAVGATNERLLSAALGSLKLFQQR